MEFSDDQSAKVSLIMTAIRKNMDGALPSDLPPDLIHEAKLRLGNHSALFKASFKGVTSMVATCVQKGLVPDPYMAQESDAKRELIEAKHGEINTQVLGVPLVDSTMPRDEEDVTHVIAGLKPNQNAHLLGAHDSSKGRSDYNQILTDHGESPHPLNNLVQPDASSMDDLQIWDRPNYDPCKALVLYDANKGKNQIEDDPHAYANKEKATFKLATSYAFIDPKDAANGIDKDMNKKSVWPSLFQHQHHRPRDLNSITSHQRILTILLNLMMKMHLRLFKTRAMHLLAIS